MDARRNIGLILSRKEDEQIVINPGQPDEIVCTVVAIEGNRVSLGFLAPRDVVIHRREIIEEAS